MNRDMSIISNKLERYQQNSCKMDDHVKNQEVEPLIVIEAFIQVGRCISLEKIVQNTLVEFTKDDIMKRCPDITGSTIDRVLYRRKDESRLESLDRGRSAKWIRRY